MKVYFDADMPDMISTFTPGFGWYTYKSIFEMKSSLSAEYGGSLELIELTPELYNTMLEAGEFVGYDPA